MNTFEKQTLKLLALQQIIDLEKLLLNDSPQRHENCHRFLCRVIVLLEMLGKIPVGKFSDVGDVIAQVRSKDLAWIPKSIRDSETHLAKEFLQHPQDKFELTRSLIANETVPPVVGEPHL